MSRALAVLTGIRHRRRCHTFRKDRRELLDGILHVRPQLVPRKHTSARANGQWRAVVEALLRQAHLLPVLGAALVLLQVVLRVRPLLVQPWKTSKIHIYSHLTQFPHIQLTVKDLRGATLLQRQLLIRQHVQRDSVLQHQLQQRRVIESHVLLRTL